MTDRNKEPFAGSYLDPLAHKGMLQDVVRTTAYDEALRRLVKPGSRVIDFGSGTGVMAIFAARHGAGHVDAIERTAFVEHARSIAARSGYPDIVFHHADHESFVGSGPADLLVSEWMGHCLFYEAMLEPLIHVRDRWLAEGGVMVPGRVSVHAALVTDEHCYEDLGFLVNHPYGIDFGPIAEAPLRQCHLVSLRPDQVTEEVVDLCTLDMKTITRTPERMAGSGRVRSPNVAYGIVAWFSMELSPDFVVGTGPFDPETHWQQVLFPFVEPIELSP
ncbi:MAG TPA: class I SAM-dependent methyltransferase, partial [Polyangiaceae bacterium]|nr:class I SAM-dependent methyltransferase [Polyangiaceae bacterium]